MRDERWERKGSLNSCIKSQGYGGQTFFNKHFGVYEVRSVFRSEEVCVDLEVNGRVITRNLLEILDDDWLVPKNQQG